MHTMCNKQELTHKILPLSLAVLVVHNCPGTSQVFGCDTGVSLGTPRCQSSPCRRRVFWGTSALAAIGYQSDLRSFYRAKRRPQFLYSSRPSRQHRPGMESSFSLPFIVLNVII